MKNGVPNPKLKPQILLCLNLQRYRVGAQLIHRRKSRFVGDIGKSLALLVLRIHSTQHKYPVPALHDLAVLT
jgi:hypothetical protein